MQEKGILSGKGKNVITETNSSQEEKGGLN